MQLLAFGEDGGRPYLAMELVRGGSLEQKLRAGRRFSWQVTIRVALEIVKALKYAHDNGVIHRDLKPANLLLAPVNDQPGTRSVTIKLADFGIAKLFSNTNQTMAGTIVGTPEYMSPEQARGGHVDYRTDIYALGLVMFAMLAGRPPFRGGSGHQIVERQQHETPPRVASLVPDVPPALDELIDRMLAKDAARRPPNALALSKCLDHVITLASSETMEDGQPPTMRGADSVSPPDETRDMPGRADPRGVTTPEEPDDDGWNGPYRETRHVEVEDLDRLERQREAARRLWQAIAAAIAFATISTVIGVGGWLIFRTPTADELVARIETRIDDARKRIDAIKDSQPDLELFLERYADDARAAWARSLLRELNIHRLGLRASSREKKANPPYLRIEREYRQAMALQRTESKACLLALQAILRMPWDDLSQLLSAAPDDELVRDVELWIDLVRVKIKEILPLARADDRAQRQDAARLEAAEQTSP